MAFYPLFLLICSLFLTSCCHERISVFSEYLVPERLACYHVGTPDPLFDCPPIGQRLSISWSVNREIGYYDAMSLHVWFRYRNHTQDYVEVPICQPNGMYIYNLIRSEYCDKGGILAYKVQLIGDGQIIDVRQHTLWVELIEFKDIDSEEQKEET